MAGEVLDSLHSRRRETSHTRSRRVPAGARKTTRVPWCGLRSCVRDLGIDQHVIATRTRRGTRAYDGPRHDARGTRHTARGTRHDDRSVHERREHFVVRCRRRACPRRARSRKRTAWHRKASAERIRRIRARNRRAATAPTRKLTGLSRAVAGNSRSPPVWSVGGPSRR